MCEREREREREREERLTRARMPKGDDRSRRLSFFSTYYTLIIIDITRMRRRTTRERERERGGEAVEKARAFWARFLGVPGRTTTHCCWRSSRFRASSAAAAAIENKRRMGKGDGKGREEEERRQRVVRKG